MQKHSYELIKHIGEVRKHHLLVYRNNYPKILFLLSAPVIAWIKLIRNSDITLIHANDGLMAFFLTPLLSKKGIKLCATLHGLDVVFDSSFYQQWVKGYLSKFSFLVAVSDGTKKACVDAGIPEEKVHVIPNAIELEKSQEEMDFKEWMATQCGVNLSDDLILSSVGRPVPRKGFYWFCKEVLPKLSNAKYLIVGPTLKYKRLVQFGQKILPKRVFEGVCKMSGVQLDIIHLLELAKTNDNLFLLGHLPKNQLRLLYNNTDLFVMPNVEVKGDFEGFGLVALEAGANGAVCLASNIEGIPSAIKHEVNGFLLPSKNKDAWTEKILELSDPKTREHWKNTFHSYYENLSYTWKQMSEAYLKLFDNQMSLSC